jgi:hypothetical protein
MGMKPGRALAQMNSIRGPQYRIKLTELSGVYIKTIEHDRK